MVHLSRVGAVIGLTVSALVACTTTPPAPPPLQDTDWLLVELPGLDGPPAAPATLRFGAAEVGGTDGCNLYQAPFRAAGDTLQIGPLGPSTLMACEPAVERQAELYRSALQSTQRYAVEAGRLRLSGNEGTVLMVLEQLAEELTGTAWQVTGYNNGRGGVVSVLQDTSLSIAFQADGSAAGEAGCNSFIASYAREGSQLNFGAIATTRKLCARPAGIMEQEQRFLAALESVAALEWEAGRLLLRTATGALAVQLTRDSAATASVTGTAGYRERIALPPEAVLTVRLVDVSRADAPAVVLAEQRIDVGAGGVPARFELAYDPGEVDPRNTYAVQARIEVPGELLFISDQHHGVLTRGAPSHVDMLLKRVESPR